MVHNIHKFQYMSQMKLQYSRLIVSAIFSCESFLHLRDNILLPLQLLNHQRVEMHLKIMARGLAPLKIRAAEKPQSCAMVE